jgi:hypothetical protein
MFEDTTGKSESVNRGKTENTMVNQIRFGERSDGHIYIYYKIL